MLPVELEIENFMSYSQARLKFNFSSALIVGETEGNERASNGSGKSSIFNAIEFSLFGETRNKTSDNVVRRGQMMCRVAFVFTHDNRTYRIVRIRNVKNSKMEVQFEELRPDGTVNDLTHDTNKLTDAEIHRVIKTTHDVFINSSYFRQNSFFDFVQGTFASRQSIISSMLNLDKWNEYQKSAKDRFKELSDKIDSRKIQLEKLAEQRQRLTVVEASTVETKELVASLNLDEVKLLDEIRGLELRLTENKDAAAEYYRRQDLQQRLSDQKQAIKMAELGLQGKRSLIDKTKLDINTNKASIQTLLQDIERAVTQLAATPKADAGKLESAILEGRSQHKILAQQIDNLCNNDSCLMCGHEWTDDAAKKGFIDERTAKRLEIEDKLKRAEPKLIAIKAELAAARQLELENEKRWLQHGKMKSNIEFSELKTKSIEEELAAGSHQLAKQLSQLEELQGLLQAVQATAKSVDLVQAEEQIKKLRQQHQVLRKRLTDTSYSLGALAQEGKSLQQAIQKLEQVETELKGLSRQAAIYGQLAKAFSKDGIQAIIIDNIVEELTQVANHWLSQLWAEPVYINFITQKRNTKGDWRETFELEFHTPTGVSQFEDFSGGEQFRISFAIRLALSVIQAKRMGGEIQLLMLDEVSTSLDPAGLEVFVSIIKRLEKDMKVLVITHDDKLKEEFEHIITVQKTSGGSTLI